MRQCFFLKKITMEKEIVNQADQEKDACFWHRHQTKRLNMALLALAGTVNARWFKCWTICHALANDHELTTDLIGKRIQ